MKGLWQEFKKFITRGNVVDMAVGVAVAAAFTAIVNAFTAGFISPLIAMLTDNSELATMKFIIRPEVPEIIDDATGAVIQAGQAEVALLWGAFLQTIIDFLIIALALFIVLKVFASLNKRAERIRNEFVKSLNEKELKEQARIEAEEKEKADIAARDEAERIAKEEAEKAKEIADEKARLERQEQLLIEIRDLLAKR